MEPSLVRMSLSDPLSRLISMDAVWKINSLDICMQRKRDDAILRNQMINTDHILYAIMSFHCTRTVTKAYGTNHLLS